jgi:hypothetical protein
VILATSTSTPAEAEVVSREAFGTLRFDHYNRR